MYFFKIFSFLSILVVYSNSINGQTNRKLPFVGKRYFDFMGGTGTGESIRINPDGTCIIIGYGCCGVAPTLIYEGEFKNPLIVQYRSPETDRIEYQIGYLIKGNKIYLLNEKGKIEKGCHPNRLECSATLLK